MLMLFLSQSFTVLLPRVQHLNSQSLPVSLLHLLLGFPVYRYCFFLITFFGESSDCLLIVSVQRSFSPFLLSLSVSSCDHKHFCSFFRSLSSSFFFFEAPAVL